MSKKNCEPKLELNYHHELQLRCEIVKFNALLMAGGMQVFLEDITDEMVADDGGPPRSINAIVPVLSGDPPSGTCPGWRCSALWAAKRSRCDCGSARRSHGNAHRRCNLHLRWSQS